MASGGLTANPLLIQIYADVTGREIEVAGAGASSALGAAMLGATAAGPGAGGYNTLADAAQHMVPKPLHLYAPDPHNSRVYDQLYTQYLRLVDTFGRDEHSVLKVLHNLSTRN